MREDESTGCVEQFFRNRRSVPVLTEPGPSRADLERALACAQTAPDHARLNPWRFDVFAGEGRQLLAEAYVRGLRLAQPEQDEAFFDRLAKMPFRAPVIIMAVCSHQSHPKVPPHEQMIAAALATYQVQCVLSELGYGSIWRTGPVAESREVARELGLADHETIVGYLYVGTPAGEPPQRAVIDAIERTRFHGI
ncbi:nitroreductase [Hahella sp. SMD15-11]|uniref:Putative NAD(P)H nitroreductase n=1 Tax=Thermohahella caldifontis TaxID=3142973 RepID=A0AB39UYS4_9GAMM